MDWKALGKFIEGLLENQLVRTFIALWIAERFHALAAERKAHDARSAEAIETQTELPHLKRHAKDVMKASSEGQSVEFKSVLDVISPLLNGEKRVSKGKKIGRFLLKCLPIVSRFVG
ncbi:MAG: hypothetical protein ACYTBJ_01760 [Planctomycetota bacterium]|jgi:hypothetical protein